MDGWMDGLMCVWNYDLPLCGYVLLYICINIFHVCRNVCVYVDIFFMYENIDEIIYTFLCIYVCMYVCMYECVYV